MAKNYFNDLIAASGNEHASLVDDGTISDTTGFIDTGCYILNAILSGSIFKGLPNNKITALAGEEATGKTFFALHIIKAFLDQNPKGMIFYFDTEHAISKEMLAGRGFDTKRVVHIPVSTVEEFNTQAMKIITKFLEIPEADRPEMFFVLDSLGNLSTTKEMADSEEGKGVRDMTRTQQIRKAFRTLTIKLGFARIPLIVTNHTYAVIGSYIPTKEMSGGGGLKYAASQILFFSKKKERDKENNVIGNIIKIANAKNRFTIENKVVECLLNYKSGLDKYFGLLDIAEANGIFVKQGNKYVVPGHDKTFFESVILKSPEKFFTPDVLKLIDEAVYKTLTYGGAGQDVPDHDEDGVVEDSE